MGEKPCPFIADGNHGNVGEVVEERPTFGVVAVTRECWICHHRTISQVSIQDYREAAAEHEEMVAMEAEWVRPARGR